MASPDRTHPAQVVFDADSMPTPPVRRAPHASQPGGSSEVRFSPDAGPSPPPRPSAAPAAVHGASAGATSATGAASLRGSRGKFKRTATHRKRVSWITWAQNHMSGISKLIVGNHCDPTCSGCDIGCFATKRVAELMAVKTFGDAVLQEKWTELVPNQTAVPAAFTDALEFVTKDAVSGKVTSVDYKVDGHTVCHRTWGAFRAIAQIDSIHRKLLNGDTCWSASEDAGARLAKRNLSATLGTAAAAWWTIRLSYYERVVAKGVIQYPRDVNFQRMYATEFVPEMQLLGHNWLSHTETRNDEVGSMATWYRGRKAALQQLAINEEGANAKPFKFKSRAQHSAYKECPVCQSRRLAVAYAIKSKMSPAEIRRRQEAYAAHLQWMMAQRRCMEEMVQLANNSGFTVENSDKCGDSSLYLPADRRKSGDNTGKYQYRMALQANVYSGKLYHLSLLLPQLTTGSNFGMTCTLNGLAAMIQAGEVPPGKSTYLRGMDGGSENVSLAGLGLNSTLVKVARRFKVVQQSRLPPSHSHHWLTDGLFSVLEGWLTGDGFAGCATLSELISYLKEKLSNAKAYKDKRIEIHVLLVNFALVKWFVGHINVDKVKRIDDPLVWRHTWQPATQSVLVQYKYSLSDQASFEKDEWGPWINKVVQVNNPDTGAIESKEVLRSASFTPTPPSVTPCRRARPS